MELPLPQSVMLLLLLLLTSAEGSELEQSVVDATTMETRHGEVFKLRLDASLLSSTSDVSRPGLASVQAVQRRLPVDRLESGPLAGLRFSPSVRDAPDLPAWLSYDFSQERSNGVVYGVPPPHVEQFQLEVIVTNLSTYETSRREVFVVVLENEDPPTHEVQLKINNMNPVDLFFGSNMDRLHEIFREVLWPQGGADLLLRLASRAAFSAPLRHLQRQVRPLWARVPCPRDFTRSSAERHFRQRGFLVDWCQFKLVSGASGRGR
ncbi:LOW QUALITY PROTEIN: epsilon-sarcoglycan-like [Pollicipes pollicipes]|uniref:LOW QUALITY PROTEIN: epsilon-sarcoglycan-like n=1 Tax=Pollicipes pollicipes TaxID=41117 RepID=UPI00188503F7|nr:LOW QUALITY PROTEIN: epsilon-sarcoglycan-like [Pollicipes pollicipes]